MLLINNNCKLISFFYISEPGAPKSVAAQWQTGNSVKVTWEMPSEPNGYVQAYNVQWALNDKDAQW